MRRRAWSFAVVILLALHGLRGDTVWAADPVAYVTEIHRGTNGEVLVKLDAEADWKVPQPLLGLHSGDQVRATGDGRAVLFYPHGGAPQTVTIANSPMIVAAPSSPGGTAQSGSTLAWFVRSVVVKSLLGMQGTPRDVQGGVRGEDKHLVDAEAPLILSPRETRLFPGRPTFEWEGNDQLRYTVRVRGPEGLLWEEVNLPRRPVSYPTAAPLLRPDVGYEWELSAAGYRAQRSPFELLSDSEALRIRDALTALEGTKREGYPPATIAVMRAAVLFHEGLFQEARSGLEAAVLLHPNEPTIHFLLGRAYAAIGLHARAVEAFQKARSLARQ